MGNIFSGGTEILFENNAAVSSQLIFAPNAEAILNNGTSINGIIMSESLILQNNAHLSYDIPFILDGPISFAALGGVEENGEEYDEAPSIIKTPIKEVNK
ncbi:hypothetical protein SPD48_10120 [Pseudogracilibacillus sp. SE30717A]|uniref:hypothetical protein n=1 Tax=Pseudogracilibacillus sp. SE30717A TaxID=3098293 RepID=UPI00300E43D5